MSRRSFTLTKRSASFWTDDCRTYSVRCDDAAAVIVASVTRHSHNHDTALVVNCTVVFAICRKTSDNSFVTSTDGNLRQFVLRRRRKGLGAHAQKPCLAYSRDCGVLRCHMLKAATSVGLMLTSIVRKVHAPLQK
jgi:hypothetical protein